VDYLEGKRAELYYLYHKRGGKIVVDRAMHTDHARQHYAGDPEFKEQWIAYTKTPLTEAEKAAFSKQYGMPFDDSPRAELKTWTPPVRVAKRPFEIRRTAKP
jgi:hypothetical protein